MMTQESQRIAAIAARPLYHERLVARISHYSDLRVRDGRLSVTLSTHGRPPLHWFGSLVLHVHGAGPLLSARVVEVRSLAGERVFLRTAPLEGHGEPARTLPSAARLRLQPRFLPLEETSVNDWITAQPRARERGDEVRAGKLLSFFDHARVRQQNQNRMAQLRKLYDAPYVDKETGELSFAFWAPGSPIPEHWLRTLRVYVKLSSGHQVHSAGIKDLTRWLPHKEVYCVRTHQLEPRLTLEPGHAPLEYIVTTACGRFRFRGFMRAQRPKAKP